MSWPAQPRRRPGAGILVPLGRTPKCGAHPPWVVRRRAPRRFQPWTCLYPNPASPCPRIRAILARSPNVAVRTSIHDGPTYTHNGGSALLVAQQKGVRNGIQGKPPRLPSVVVCDPVTRTFREGPRLDGDPLTLVFRSLPVLVNDRHSLGEIRVSLFTKLLVDRHIDLLAGLQRIHARNNLGELVADLLHAGAHA